MAANPSTPTVSTSRPSSTSYAPGSSRTLCPERNSKGSVPRLCLRNFNNGPLPVFLKNFGNVDWPNTTNCKGSPGSGKPLMARTSKRPWPKNLSVRTQRIGKKKERNDTCSSMNLASRSRYTSTPPTGMTAWRWNLCYRPLWFNHRPPNPQSATCVWTLGMLAKRRPSAAMVSFPTSDPEERKRKTLKIVRNTRREGESLN